MFESSIKVSYEWKNGKIIDIKQTSNAKQARTSGTGQRWLGTNPGTRVAGTHVQAPRTPCLRNAGLGRACSVCPQLRMDRMSSDVSHHSKNEYHPPKHSIQMSCSTGHCCHHLSPTLRQGELWMDGVQQGQPHCRHPPRTPRTAPKCSWWLISLSRLKSDIPQHHLLDFHSKSREWWNPQPSWTASGPPQ